MKKYKGLIALGVVLIIYGVIMFVLFGNQKVISDIIEDSITDNSNDTSKNNDYLVLDNYTYKYDKDEKIFVKVRNSLMESYDKLTVYVNNKFFGKYKIQYVDGWNLFNDNGEFISYSGNIITATDGLNLKVRNIKVREINEQDKIDLIKEYNISTFSYLTINEVIDVDLDNNNQMDEVICLSSKEESGNNNTYYDLVTVKLNGEYQKLIYKQENDNSFYTLMSVINYFDNKYDSIYLSKVTGIVAENSKIEDFIINNKNGKYVID